MKSFCLPPSENRSTQKSH